MKYVGVDIGGTNLKAGLVDENGNHVNRPETYVYWSYLGASYWAINAGMMRDMARATGRDAAKYERMEAEAS